MIPSSPHHLLLSAPVGTLGQRPPRGQLEPGYRPSRSPRTPSTCPPQKACLWKYPGSHTIYIGHLRQSLAARYSFRSAHSSKYFLILAALRALARRAAKVSEAKAGGLDHVQLVRLGVLVVSSYQSRTAVLYAHDAVWTCTSDAILLLRTLGTIRCPYVSL